MFQEYTAYWLQEEVKNDPEIYLHFNEKGKLIRAYCYADDIPCTTKYSANWKPKTIKARTIPSQNPLFVNLTNSFILKNLNKILISIEDDEFNKDEILQLAVKNYKNLSI